LSSLYKLNYVALATTAVQCNHQLRL